VSERRALGVTGWPRSTHRYQSRASDQTPLRMRLRDLALARPRYGYRRLTILLRREGWHVNAKRVYRLYREEGLTVRVKRRKKLASHARVRPPAAARVNDRWSMDFVADSLSNGGKIRVLTVIDSFTRECLALKIARSLPARAVTEVLDSVIAKRGAPRTIQVDNGSEFTSNHFDAWAYLRGIDVDFIRPGKPVDNAHIESFNGRLRDECLNSRWFEGIDDARQALQAWRRDYNEVRPHSSLGDLPPAVFAAQIQGVAPELCSQD
jgi:putative transposase